MLWRAFRPMRRADLSTALDTPLQLAGKIAGQGGKAARGACGQHRRGCPQAEGAECICLLRGHGRTPRFPAKPYRSHRAGGGQ